MENDLRVQLEELKKRLEVLEESIDPVDEVMLSVKARLRRKLEGGGAFRRSMRKRRRRPSRPSPTPPTG